VEADGPRKRRWGQGSLFYSPAKRVWIGVYVSKETGKRKAFSGLDWRKVERRLDTAVALSKRPRKAYRLTVRTRRIRAERWVTEILQRGASEGWAYDYTARVIIAQLAPGRLRADIFGPCVYCGQWVAGTIDHVVPRHRGGTNDRENLVSACYSCNSRKGHRTAVEWAV
jgi:5-methylcytosine-specific restriction endonuclease McrA